MTTISREIKRQTGLLDILRARFQRAISSWADFEDKAERAFRLHAVDCWTPEIEKARKKAERLGRIVRRRQARIDKLVRIKISIASAAR